VYSAVHLVHTPMPHSIASFTMNEGSAIKRSRNPARERNIPKEAKTVAAGPHHTCAAAAVHSTTGLLLELEARSAGKLAAVRCLPEVCVICCSACAALVWRLLLSTDHDMAQAFHSFPAAHMTCQRRCHGRDEHMQEN
jgi:hypothetical protein